MLEIIENLTAEKVELTQLLQDQYLQQAEMKQQHETMIRQLNQEHLLNTKSIQSRYDLLQEKCEELENAFGEAVREKTALLQQLQSVGKDDKSLRELVGLKLASANLEERKQAAEEKLLIAEAKIQELTVHVASLHAELADCERKRMIADSELKEMISRQAKSMEKSTQKSSKDLMEACEELGRIQDLQAQVQSLSQQVVRKQAVIMDLQAEKTTLSYKVNELLNR